MSRLGAYYRLTKPGIIYGNLLTVIAGYFFANTRPISWMSFAGVVFGTTGVIASACVVNNYIDRRIDRRMQRTKKRALVVGSITPRAALMFAGMLGLSGFAVLALYTNPLTVGVGVIGFIDYVIAYTYIKRHSVYGTLVGTICGAMPIVAGYTAATGIIDANVALLFASMVFWQMVHFYAIAMYRAPEYAAAHIPVMPLVRGKDRTRLHMMYYIAAFLAAVIALHLYGSAGIVFLVVMISLGVRWFIFAARAYHEKQSDAWARRMFGQSLQVLLGMSVLLTGNTWLP